MAKVLGRGLSSLIPQKRTVAKDSSLKEDVVVSNSFLDNKQDILEIDVEKIKPNSRQPRKEFNETVLNELASSIKEYGIIQPLVVQKRGDEYELIVGERRLRASKIAGLKKVPVIVRNFDEQRKLEVSLIENVQREDLNPIEKASAYKELMDEFDLKVEEVAKKVGKSRPVISNTLRLLTLSSEIQDALSKGSISEAHAVNLAGVPGEVKQMNIFRKIKDNKWTVDKTKKEIRKIGGTKESRIKINYKDRESEQVLRNFFESKVEIKRGNKGGSIIIDFYSDEELSNIVAKLK